MTIENSESFRGFEVYCDFCNESESYDFGRDEWSELMAEMKSDGWKTFKEDGVWKHKCPGCCAI
jgi:hypothetical protein